ncbi:MAG TPA: PAS domain S-box protein [Methylomirabilota bacterium]|nr:PAS domain S-box protein [Methylomirabilota bacterium]
MEAGAASVLLGEEALTPAFAAALGEVLGRQPSWSDLPILLLTGPGPDSATAAAAVSRLGNVTLFERPVRVASLVSAVRAALRARWRQYELRDRLALQTLLAAIVESSDDAIVGKTTAGIILTWNKAAERLFGYTAAEAVGQSILILIPPARHDEEREILARITRGERVTHFETVRMTKDGRRFDASLTISPIRDASGHIVGASKVARDISAQKRAEHELREADRRKDEFLAMLAHELRNPLAPIHSSLAILEQASRTDPMVDKVRGILERQVGHMVRLVDDLMEVSRITRGKIELHRRRLDLSEAIRSALETSEPLIRRAGLTLVLELPAESLFVDADPVRLTQIVSNLLNNAAKYSAGAKEVRLAAGQKNGQAEISVQDFGIGIPADMLERVFDMFTQVPAVARGGQPGLGIGLTLVRSLVQLHGGTIGATSAGPGKGSTFTFRLPLVGPPMVDEERHAGNGGNGLSLRILVVDDNQDAADSMGLVLERAGAEVEVVHDGFSALDRVERFHPALILLDIGMPGMDGYEVARRIRARPAFRDVMLVALTGWGQAEDRRRSLDAGFDHHLIKPAGVDQVRALVPSVGDSRG